MKTLIHLTASVLLVSVVLVVGPQTVMAQDLAKVAPNTTKVLLENDRVRVLEVHYKPGEKAAMHAHPATLLYPLSAGKLKSTTPDGKSTENEVSVGQANWIEAVTHATENVGTTDVRTLVIELKK